MSSYKPKLDLSVYLVTGRELLPPGKDYYESLEESLRGHRVTVVQIREKNVETSEFLEIAKKSLEICDRYEVPMLINDNLAVALALPERVGLHIGQTDIPIHTARRLLGPNRVLGLSVHNSQQAKQALQDGIADYVGVGPVYGTKSKSGIQDKDVLGPRGAYEVARELRKGDRYIPFVLIGGINQDTAARALHAASDALVSPNGIAVISAIVSNPKPAEAASELSQLVRNHQRSNENTYPAVGYAFPVFSGGIFEDTETDFYRVRVLYSTHRSRTNPPLIQTLTSHVSSTLSANVALAFSSSPIMSHQEVEADDLARLDGAVVLNIGTIGEEARRGMRAVGRAANKAGKPIVLDPVGVGASSFRKEVVNEIMNHTQITLLKGNAAELSSIAGLNEVQSRGVDSGSGQLSDPVGLVRRLALKEKCLVLMTGKEDYLSDGVNCARISNGHELLGRITGSGCALGVVLAAGLSAACYLQGPQSGSAEWDNLMIRKGGSSFFHGALMAILAFEIAAEIAAERSDVKGPGSFIPAFIDELAALKEEDIIQRAKVEMIHRFDITNPEELPHNYLNFYS